MVDQAENDRQFAEVQIRMHLRDAARIAEKRGITPLRLIILFLEVAGEMAAEEGH